MQPQRSIQQALPSLSHVFSPWSWRQQARMAVACLDVEMLWHLLLLMFQKHIKHEQKTQ